ncbi:MAG: hypothetical protein PF692_15655 [Kiritimatiellae bacterium]|jgi:hypothetical protein|nr:hypothetical protein [Kiritimatiellia bacterium]
MKKLIHMSVCIVAVTLSMLIAKYAIFLISGDVRPTGGWAMLLALFLVGGPAFTVSIVSFISGFFLVANSNPRWPFWEFILSVFLLVLFFGPDAMQILYGCLPDGLQVILVGVFATFIIASTSWNYIASIRKKCRMHTIINAMLLLIGIIELIILGMVFIA